LSRTRTGVPDGGGTARDRKNVATSSRRLQARRCTYISLLLASGQPLPHVKAQAQAWPRSADGARPSAAKTVVQTMSRTGSAVVTG
jgi:hypothetical protein